MTTVLEEASKLVSDRLSELDDERKRLERALVELNGGKPKPRRGRPPLSPGPKAAKPGRKKRKRKGGTRADGAVELIEKNPGISASDIAKTMKIKPNYLYRVLGDLEKEGRVRKDGRTYFPTSPAK